MAVRRPEVANAPVRGTLKPNDKNMSRGASAKIVVIKNLNSTGIFLCSLCDT